ncbi:MULTISPECIES: adenylosuccinate synthase [unclassified Isoptericola]|uniref:adenylosuccinate synthase n=1 Tax=unclassified Isoptericola TaxID=2623355 RepID=UPI0027133087|nr:MULTISPECIES: adenylosuccinate synthase [unclassified Isoptericola]MDO8143467.1 adenylosuccinate synthase [Isoptericola sp. 178]MDO8147328.1 adenylosuccinate synthase [Isoptericola sp. b515]MDO8150355.1 adenylosuccinate synthase [Isoptericola sp. b408]
MPAVVLVGAQWGDEGKGKATDLLGDRVDYVVKFNGGNNAGHTVVIGDEKYALHLLPSGILSPGVTPVIANGVVVDIDVLFEELDALEARGVDTSKLMVSSGAHVIASYHRTVDKVTERFLGKRRIGTTGRGIGPAYADKINRVGIRVADLFDPKILREKVEGALDQKNHLLVKVYNRRAVDVDEVVEELLGHAERLRPMVADTGLALNQALDAGHNVLFEGGQATMLDVDHGTYPFVTSSNATAGGAVTGSGVGPTRIDSIIGVIKAYTTRVGEGPFPTELFDANGEYLLKTGGEYGVTTGRARRCGWYDAVIARYAARVNGLTDLVVTKLDVLTGIEKIPVCVAYDVDGTRYDEMPDDQSAFHHATPIYEELPGWWEDISQCRSFDELPTNAQAYVRALEKMSGCRISAVGVGPRRDEIIPIHDLIHARA